MKEAIVGHRIKIFITIQLFNQALPLAVWGGFRDTLSSKGCSTHYQCHYEDRTTVRVSGGLIDLNKPDYQLGKHQNVKIVGLSDPALQLYFSYCGSQIYIAIEKMEPSGYERVQSSVTSERGVNDLSLQWIKSDKVPEESVNVRCKKGHGSESSMD